MTPNRRREPDAKRSDVDKPDSTPVESPQGSDPVAFIEPAPNEPNDTPLDKDREQSR